MTPRRPSPFRETRRHVLHLGASTAGFALLSCGATTKSANAPESKGEKDEAEVTPAEDLMQEHGVLQRVVIIYDTAALRIERNEQLDLELVTKAASVVRRFVEDYHERTEEKFVFPRLQAAGREPTLIATLLRQHERGRQLTDEIQRRAAERASLELAEVLRSFGRMYRAHASREDTIIFPAFRQLLDDDGYRELGERFEEREHELLGKEGFEGAVAQVAALETQLGIADLATFTPAS